MIRRVVRHMPRHKGVAAWNEILGPGPSYPLLERETTSDFIVVGAGFAGLSSTRRLLQLDPTAKIVVLEAGRIAEAASGRNSGFMIDLPQTLIGADDAEPNFDAAQIHLNRQAIDFASDAVAEYAINPDYFDPAGKVTGAATGRAEAHNSRFVAHLTRLGEPFEHLDAQAMLALTGSRHYHSGLYTPGTVMLQPAGYIRGLAASLGRHVSLHEHSPALALVRVGDVWRVQTPRGQVTAPKLILATNGHLESFGFAQGRLIQVFLYASMTPALDPATLKGAARWGVTPSDPMGTTLRRIDQGQGGNRLITSVCATVRSGMRASDSDLRRATAVQRARFDARFPQLAGLKPEYEWAGHVCLTRNGAAVTGELEPGLFSACVQNGLSTVRGTLTGIAAAEMAMGRTSNITAHFAGEALPPKLPLLPIRDITANVAIRWKEWQAREE